MTSLDVNSRKKKERTRNKFIMVIIKNPPLKSFRIDFKLNKPKKLSFEMMAQFENAIKEKYPIAPNINIIEYPSDILTKIDFPIQIGPIQFLNEEKTRQIHFYSNGLIFIFTEYSSWKDIKNKIIETLKKLNNNLKIKEIEQIRMEYIDEFNFPSKGFELKKFFKLHTEFPSNWEIDYNDFYCAIKVLTSESDKYIIRLRGLSSKKEGHFCFNLENIYIRTKNFSIENEGTLNDELDDIYDIIEDKFLNIMHKLMKTYINFENNEKNELIEDSIDPVNSDNLTSWIKNFIEAIINIVKQLYDNLKRIYYDLKELLPEIFDKFIEGLLLYWKATRKEPVINFQQIFTIFQIIGLKEIYPATFDKINGALQWKICPVDFITIEFLNSYKNSLLSNVSEDVLIAIDDLIDTLLIFQKEQNNQKELEKELANILND